ncbi:MAG: sensor histidine kinase [Timaviella obliquedivisa GSE-PSE-MK23-08B]|jgi:signal transduction histidine kinase|nr:sensor histidine kinase [Timaviella obliquedivisa GSE-PSE-MK23-08B]
MVGTHDLSALEKENRILQKKLERAEATCRELDATNQRKEAFLRQIIQESRESQDVLEQRTAELQQVVQQLQQALSDRQAAELQLKQQAQNLEQALNDLQRTQSQLIQSEKMSSLGQLVAGIAHEINNPVSFVYGNINHVEAYFHSLLSLIGHYQTYYPNPELIITKTIAAIELDFLRDDLPKLLESMRRGTERIKKIVLSLRNFARMDESEFKAVDLHEGIESTLMILENRLKAQAHRSTIEIIREYEHLPLVECYAGQMNQVFVNILVNAIDAFDEQRQDVDLLENSQSDRQNFIRIITSMTDAQYATIRFVDNGLGIAEADQKRLFDPFFTTKPVGKGTGMGLAIAYQTVTERHRGTLECLSSVGQGAEFIIRIPLHHETR